MANFKDLVTDQDPRLITQSLELLAAFRHIKNPEARQKVTELARALRRSEAEVAPAPGDARRDR